SGRESADSSILPAYREAIVARNRPARPVRVVVDCGNGVASLIAISTLRAIGAEVTPLFADSDGTFPNHHPDPTVPENLRDLQARVIAERADLGIAFDGDGDRIGVVDGEGEILWGDQLMVLYAREILAEQPGATVIADVKASQVLFDEIKRAGGEPLMWRTGHSLIKAKMAETGAPLAGEMSGHIFFADRYFGFDDALYAAVRILNIVSQGDQSLAEMRNSLPRVVNTPELRFPCSEERKFVVVQETAGRLRQAGADVNDIDGVRVRTADGWWLLRASNTQDVLVARCESATSEGLERLKAAVVAELTASGVAAPKF
ncbi:MAG TPA: phosphomannomutase/phosphoglucomutase, partial [Verrucomicrobiae bacterium]|nr:phosphomannomutase/phosphoglucomutase [Verrucomicrobiae bacterium]